MGGQFQAGDEAKFRPKTDQNRCQKRSRRKKALEDRLGAVLGRFWVVLGAVLEGKNCLKRFVLNGFVRINVFEKLRCQEMTWADLGSIWGAKRLQNEGRGGSKSEMR